MCQKRERSHGRCSIKLYGDEVVAGLCGRGAALLLEVKNAHGQVLLSASLVVDIVRRPGAGGFDVNDN